MCGRIANTLPHEAMSQLFRATPANDLPNLPNYNLCPTDQLCVVTSDAGTRHLTSMRWGFIPHWYKTPSDGPLLINARSETIAEKPAFRAAVRERRCLIPATGFYEWTKDDEGKRLPWYIHAANDDPLVFAGIWQNWEMGGESLNTFAIVTTGASPKMQAIHHRQPVTLEPDQHALWLGEEGKGAATLMKPAPDEQLDFFRVDPKVNSNRAEGPGLIEPLD